MAEDKVLNPEHYTFGKVQIKDAWESCLSPEALRGLYKGNIIKYLWRYEHKGGVEDLRKAMQYLKWLIKEVEKDDQKVS